MLDAAQAVARVRRASGLNSASALETATPSGDILLQQMLMAFIAADSLAAMEEAVR